MSAIRRVAQRVGQQVADDLREPDWVGFDGRQLVGHVGRDLDVALGSVGGGPGDRVDEQGPHVDRLAVQRQATGLGLGDRAQVVDQSLERRDGVQDGRQVRGIGRIDAVRDGLDVGAHDGQRRAQLVRHVGQEAAAFSLVDSQPGAHLVERSRQCPRLAWTALRDLHVEIAGLDASGRRDQVVDGLGQAAQPAGAADDGQHDEHKDGKPDHHADARAGPDETSIGPGDRRHQHGAEGDEDDDRAAESLGRPWSPPTPRPRAPRSMASGATVWQVARARYRPPGRAMSLPHASSSANR